MPRAPIRWAVAALLALAVPAAAAPRDATPRLDPRQVSPLASHIRRVAPAVVGIRVDVPRDRPSAATLGVERWGSGVIFDANQGYLLTVSYILLDASRIEVSLRDGRKVPARLVGLDLEVGVGVARLEGPGPWPAAVLGDSTAVAAGDATGTVGVSDDGDLVATPSRVQAVRPFAAAWEYMLDRAFIVTPSNAAFGGAALVNTAGSVIGVTSLRLGEAPHVNLAIPMEKFLAGKDELLAQGRVMSRAPRPWLGLYTAEHMGQLVVVGIAEGGPADRAGLKRGDILQALNGDVLDDVGDFYKRLWASGPAGSVVTLRMERDSDAFEVTVRTGDRAKYHKYSND